MKLREVCLSAPAKLADREHITVGRMKAKPEAKLDPLTVLGNGESSAKDRRAALPASKLLSEARRGWRM
jgi:hypothetical protein